MRKNRLLIAVYLLAAMLLMSSIFAVQGSLLTPMIEHFALSGESQGMPNLAAFIGGILALLLAFVIQKGLYERSFLAGLNAAIVVAVLMAAAALVYLLFQIWAAGAPRLLICPALGLAFFLAGIAFLFKRHGFLKKITKRVMLRLALYICALMLALLSAGTDFNVVVGLWACLGFGLGLMDTVLSACMADLYPGAEGPRMMGILHTVFGIGSVLTPMATGVLLAKGMHYQRIYRMIAMGILCLLGFSAIVREVFSINDTEQMERGREKAAESGTGTDLRLPGLILAMFAHGIFLSGLNTWINRYADLLPGMFAFPAQSFLFAGIMLSRLLVPFLPIRTERYVLSGGIGAGIVLALGLVTGNGLALRLSLLVSGLLAGALLPCMLSIGCSGHREDTLMVTTSMLLALYLGQGVSAPVIAGLDAAFGLVSGIFLCALCMVLTSLTARFHSSTSQTVGRRGK